MILRRPSLEPLALAAVAQDGAPQDARPCGAAPGRRP